MTDNLTHNLNLLADEVDPATVDSYDIIDKARARTRNQRTGLASALGVVAVAVAMAATIGLTGSEPEPMTGAASSTTSVTSGDGARICGQKEPDCNKPPTPYQPDERSLKLDGQLAPVVDTVITPRWHLTKTDYPMYAAVGALQFVRTEPRPDVPSDYSAYARMTNTAGQFELSITVSTIPADTPFGQVTPQIFGPCTDGVDGCELRELGDGTKATALADGTLPGIVRSSTLTAQRPDGTYVKVVARPLQNGPAPFSNEDLFAFADVFTY